MQDYPEIVYQSPLFQGISAEELTPLLATLSVGIKHYKKNEFLLHSGNPVPGLGLLLSGSASILKEDFWGNRNILSKLEAGDLFAETFACLPGTLLTVSVLADASSEVLFLDVRRILPGTGPGTSGSTQLLQNLLLATARKNLLLNEKMTHLSRRTTREKLLSYLSAEAVRQKAAGTNVCRSGTYPCTAAEFDIPFNRQQLADYLSVDRSAMSAELCRMREEGLLTFHKNHFTLL